MLYEVQIVFGTYFIDDALGSVDVEKDARFSVGPIITDREVFVPAVDVAPVTTFGPTVIPEPI